ncbi:hypothetical protein AAFG07_31640 [Bradyrhizobium sp. B097]|uniref:hypothetical protein n=1 Tax=Bradyrhizobium sp. B097 TaxID=3140244 RepID=UPI00318419DE
MRFLLVHNRGRSPAISSTQMIATILLPGSKMAFAIIPLHRSRCTFGVEHFGGEARETDLLETA